MNKKSISTQISGKSAQRIKFPIIYIMIAIVAMVCYACGPQDPGTSSEPVTTYNTGVCYYYGDWYQTGTSNFVIDMYNASDDNVGVWIEGFCTLSLNFSKFELNTGTYSIAATGHENTFLKGDTDDDANFIGTYVYDLNAKTITLVTGGTFDVTYTGNKYTISTNFTGKDYSSGKTVNNLRYKFTGTIAFSDESNSDALSFTDIAQSNYMATGTPGYMTTPGPSTWTGQIAPSTGTDQYYAISGWGGVSLTVYCDFMNGKITVDNYTKVVDDGTYEGYFQAIAIDKNAKMLYIVPDDYDYAVAYNKSTKVMDFSGTYNGFPIYVGIIGKTKNTGAIAGSFTDLYANAKLTLTSALRSSSATVKAPALSYSESLSFTQLKGYTMGKPIMKKSPDKLFNRSNPIFKNKY